MKTKVNNKIIRKPRWHPRVATWKLQDMKVGDEKIVTESCGYFRNLVSRNFRKWGWTYSTWSITHNDKPGVLLQRTG
jgi:hypothetical protein